MSRSCFPPSPSLPSPLVRVIVVGAGLAGLFAGYRLLRSSTYFEVLVLEASSHPGGRCKSISSSKSFSSSHPDFLFTKSSSSSKLREEEDGFVIDLGPEFIHGNSTLLYSFAAASSSSSSLPEEVFTWAQGDGGPSERPCSRDGGAGYYYFDKKLTRFDSLPPDILYLHEVLSSMSSLHSSTLPQQDSSVDMRTVLTEVYSVSDRALSLAEAGYGNTVGDDLCNLSWKLNCEAEVNFLRDGNGDFRIGNKKRGFANYYIDLFSKDLKILYNQIVYKISQNGKTIEVFVDNGRSQQQVSQPFVCDYLIFTPPVSILKRKDVIFSPPLPENKLRAIDSIKTSIGFKLILKLNKRIGPIDFHGMICANSLIPEVWINNDDGGGGAKFFYFTGFCMGSFAVRALSQFPHRRERGEKDLIQLRNKGINQLTGIRELRKGSNCERTHTKPRKVKELSSSSSVVVVNPNLWD